MEELFNKQDAVLKKLLKEIPLEKPSLDFSKKVMLTIEKQKVGKTYRPLISKRVLLGIGAIFILSLVWLYFNPSSSMYSEEALSLSEKLNFKMPFNPITLSKTAIYAIGFMALFFLQIPFLKRIIEKNYL
ncbi:MAG: hypothetical protein R2776_04860 [Flavobacteriaceae bacterium]|nr:hypothetical protein [Flavobacteriaceae bacterium]